MNPEKPPVNRGIPPPGYQEALYWKISGKPLRLVILNLLGTILLIPWGGIFFWLAATLGRLPRSIELSSPSRLLIALTVLIMVLILHELVHGVMMLFFGARPHFGIMWKEAMFYATSPGFAYPRGQYLLVALAPLVVISLLAVLAMILLAGTAWVALAAFVAMFNAAGSIGDLWISLVVLHYPAHAYVIDERDGIRIFLAS